MNRRSRIYRRLAWLFAALLGLALLAGAGLYGWTWKVSPAPAIRSLALAPTRDVHVGTVVVCRAVLDCPWYRIPLLPLELTPPDGCQQLGDGARALVGIGPGTWRWACSVALQPYQTGQKEGGKLSVVCTPDRYGKSDPLAVALPRLEVVPTVTDDERALQVVPRLSAAVVGSGWSWWQWTGLAVLILLLVVAVVSLWRRRSEARFERVVPPWETALVALQQVEQALPMPAEAFFVPVTDVLRAYIEARFQIPATEQTTPEFLAALQRGHALGTEHRLVLTEFLSVADMIKFARADATQEQLGEALSRAKRFVVETKPQLEAVPPPVPPSPGAGPGPGAPPVGEARQP